MSLNFSEVSEHSFDDTGDICLLLGSNKTMLSNRLSFALNLKGKSRTQVCDIIDIIRIKLAQVKGILFEAQMMGSCCISEVFVNGDREFF